MIATVNLPLTSSLSSHLYQCTNWLFQLDVNPEFSTTIHEAAAAQIISLSTLIHSSKKYYLLQLSF